MHFQHPLAQIIGWITYVHKHIWTARWLFSQLPANKHHCLSDTHGVKLIHEHRTLRVRDLAGPVVLMSRNVVSWVKVNGGVGLQVGLRLGLVMNGLSVGSGLGQAVHGGQKWVHILIRVAPNSVYIVH